MAWQRVYVDLLGYAEGELPDGNEAWANLIHPLDHGLAERLLIDRPSGGSDLSGTLRFRRKDGTWAWLRVSGRIRERDGCGGPLLATGACIDVTAERESAERLEVAIRAAGAGLWDWNVATGALTWNRGFHAMLDEAVPPGPLDGSYFFERIHPQDQPQVVAAVEAAFADPGIPFDCDMRLRRLSGGWRWTRSVGAVVERGPNGRPLRMLGQVLPIDEAVRVRERLARVQENLQLFVRYTPSAVAMVDRDLRYLVASQDWNRAYGLGDEDLTGRSHYDVFPTIPERWKVLHQRALRGEVLSAERDPFVREDGSTDHVRWRLYPWRDDGGEIGGIIMFTEMVNEQVEHERALEAAKEQAERASQAKSTFLASMSHEIRTPMNGVLGMLEVLLGGELCPEQREQAATARRSAEALLAIINDILDFSKIEAGKLELERRTFPLLRLLEDVCAVTRPLAEDKRIGLSLDAGSQLDAVSGDEHRLRQVLLNLVGNGLKFTESGGVSVRCWRLDGDRVRFEVEDTGIGIAAADQTRLFASFSQVDSSISRRFGGTGLGLAISQRLIELMGGTIGVQSELGVGSTFWFEVDLPPASEIPREGSAGDAPVVPVRRLRILLADDNAVNRMVGAALVERLGHHVEAAQDGTEVLERLDRGEIHDLILMDVQMPGLDGLDTTRAIRARGDAAASVPIVALTAHALSSDEARCREAGMDDYLTKPICSRRLAEVLKSIAATTDPA